MMRITIIFHKNCFGGSVKIQNFLAKVFREKGYVVSLLALENSEEEGYFTHENYDVIWKNGEPSYFFAKLLAFKTAIEETQPDLIISAVDYNNRFSVFSSKLLNKKVIACEHGNHTTLTAYKRGRLKGYLRSLRRRMMRFLSYKMADAVTFLTHFDFDYYQYLSHRYIMLNPVTTMIPNNNLECVKENIILFPSRLDENKRPLFLLEAFTKVNTKGFKIVFLGEGNQLENCQKFAKQHHLDVQFLPFTTDIESWYQKAKIVVLTSLSEGLPNILVEAMFYNCVRLATDCLTGPKELIDDGVDGFLSNVNDCDEFSRKLQQLIDDENLRIKMCENAKLRCQDFLPEKVAQSWISLVEEINSKK